MITYDEWGGFFDHVAPPVLPDSSASEVDRENWGQAGFRVPTVLASPYAQRGFVDHTVYDHTSVLRFLEWRFLGAPAEGPGKASADWFLTERDRNANNIGTSLSSTRVALGVGFDLDFKIDPPSEPCAVEAPDAPPGPTPATSPPPLAAAPASTPTSAPKSELQQHPLEQAMHAGWFERLGIDVKVNPLARRWANGVS